MPSKVMRVLGAAVPRMLSTPAAAPIAKAKALREREVQMFVGARMGW
jgi:hypothetical protein